MKIQKMDDTIGDVVSATGHEVVFDNGLRLKSGEQVYLPPAAGGGLGEVDYIQMLFDPKKDELEIHIRIVDGNDKGHLFIFPIDD